MSFYWLSVKECFVYKVDYDGLYDVCFFAELLCKICIWLCLISEMVE